MECEPPLEGVPGVRGWGTGMQCYGSHLEEKLQPLEGLSELILGTSERHPVLADGVVVGLSVG